MAAPIVAGEDDDTEQCQIRASSRR
jgi:hypothetical protein